MPLALTGPLGSSTSLASLSNEQPFLDDPSLRPPVWDTPSNRNAWLWHNTVPKAFHLYEICSITNLVPVTEYRSREWAKYKVLQRASSLEWVMLLLLVDLNTDVHCCYRQITVYVEVYFYWHVRWHNVFMYSLRDTSWYYWWKRLNNWANFYSLNHYRILIIIFFPVNFQEKKTTSLLSILLFYSLYYFFYFISLLFFIYFFFVSLVILYFISRFVCYSFHFIPFLFIYLFCSIVCHFISFNFLKSTQG
jgi:hypothetical protein